MPNDHRGRTSTVRSRALQRAGVAQRNIHIDVAGPGRRLSRRWTQGAIGEAGTAPHYRERVVLIGWGDESGSDESRDPGS